MLTLHISGGTKMLEEALSVVQGTKIKLIGVTVLTSMNNEDLNELGVAREVKITGKFCLQSLQKRLDSMNSLFCIGSSRSAPRMR
ncbi:orotidine 5'-phosphate decarboxylase [Trichonephila clavata]|uniref:Orotidine 5'-phosphate decarboxylase n=1 Tax=Trichonephila clavata TaxID=2740835 RepID=A0A8X6GDT0_TRICU|nr:orotidine 5'-phosphate decarboxylase [Trichonephila clavata]